LFRKVVVCLPLTVLLLTVAEAQQPTKVSRIGYLNATSFTSFEAGRAEAFRHGLRELGYMEGRNIVIEYRYADGKQDQLRGFAAEMVRLKVDAIVTSVGASTRAAKQATVTIPIVMKQDNDPVGNGFVASLARPGGNITGLSRVAPELSGKQLELLKETIPGLSRVADFATSTSTGHSQRLRETELAAAAFGVTLQFQDVLSPKDFETAFREASEARANAVLMQVSGPVYNPRRRQVVELAVQTRLPMMYRNREDVEADGLMSYGVNITDLDRRAATYVDKILKGAKPADLPVEQPTKFEFAVNLKTAKQIGLTMPPNVLARADRVIQ